MKTASANTKLVDGYIGLLDNLSTNNKLDLISKLSESIKIPPEENTSRFYQAFGEWDKHESADELVKNIHNSRNFNRNREEF